MMSTSAISMAVPTADNDVLDLLRALGPMDVAAMSGEFEVTPTAVRQRLSRLLANGLVEREPVRHGRGRPRHNYNLTPKGVRLTGSNWPDLALALWREISAVADYEVRRSVLIRVLKALSASYGQEVEGLTTLQRMRSLAELLNQRRVPFSVQQPNGSPILTAHACPYPELSAGDRSICAMERALFSELVGKELRLTKCRHDGGPNCQFQPV
jgi:DeoR family transcriptional regulator, suf operon transcriptional repressor